MTRKVIAANFVETTVEWMITVSVLTFVSVFFATQPGRRYTTSGLKNPVNFLYQNV